MPVRMETRITQYRRLLNTFFFVLCRLIYKRQDVGLQHILDCGMWIIAQEQRTGVPATQRYKNGIRMWPPDIFRIIDWRTDREVHFTSAEKVEEYISTLPGGPWITYTRGGPCKPGEGALYDVEIKRQTEAHASEFSKSSLENK